MITIKELLITNGLPASQEEIILVRHGANKTLDHPWDVKNFEHIKGKFTPEDLYKRGEIGRFLETQSKTFSPAFRSKHEKGVKYIIEVLGFPTIDKVIGVYSFNGLIPALEVEPDWWELFDEDSNYLDIERLTEFDELLDRTYIEWGKGKLAWIQNKDKPVIDVDDVVPFPEHRRDVKVDFHTMKELFQSPKYEDWRLALAYTCGVYIITDTSDGKSYVGSGYGKAGIWDRWQEYANTGDCGNKHLVDRDPNNFQWTILEYLPYEMSQDEVIRIENQWMDSLDTRNSGLN